MDLPLNTLPVPKYKERKVSRWGDVRPQKLKTTKYLDDLFKKEYSIAYFTPQKKLKKQH
tara:strand:- start:214 stop:390 length:177 start_codon:yes stop_codon:yes gene_type:complete